MRKQNSVWADSFSVVTHKTFSDEVVDYLAEDRAYEQIRMRGEDTASRSIFEDTLYSMYPCGNFRRDPITDQLHIYRTATFYAYTLDIHYTVNGQPFANRIDAIFSSKLRPEWRLRVTCLADDPSRIVDISEHGPGFLNILQKLFRKQTEK